MDKPLTPVECGTRSLRKCIIRWRHILVDGLAGHGHAALAQHGPAKGDRVLDVGCGMGDTSVDLGKRVGSQGLVLGVDCCEAFLDYGRAEAARAAASNVSFENGDVATRRFEPMYDYCFSRFGTMFFVSPVAAMRNILAALKPGGRLVMVVWRAIEHNEGMFLPKRVALRHLPPPDAQAPNCGPGPFSMGSREVVSDILQAAGYSDLHVASNDLEIMVGNTVDDAIDFQLAMGPAGESSARRGPSVRPRGGPSSMSCARNSLRSSPREG